MSLVSESAVPVSGVVEPPVPVSPVEVPLPVLVSPVEPLSVLVELSDELLSDELLSLLSELLLSFDEAAASGA